MFICCLKRNIDSYMQVAFADLNVYSANLTKLSHIILI